MHASNDRLEHDIGVCVKHQVPIMITSLRAPQSVVEAAHSYGGIVLHDVINVRHARKAAEAGVDGLILVCAGAGGHAGALSPFALLAEVRSWFKGTIALSGAIANGAAVLAAQAMGADLAYVGTRFIATREANAKPEYKQMLIDTSAGDIVYSSLFSGVLGNYLKPSVAAAGLRPRQPAGRRQVQDELRIDAARPGATSGAPARASAASPMCRPSPNAWPACARNTPRRPATSRAPSIGPRRRSSDDANAADHLSGTLSCNRPLHTSGACCVPSSTAPPTSTLAPCVLPIVTDASPRRRSCEWATEPVTAGSPIPQKPPSMALGSMNIEFCRSNR